MTHARRGIDLQMSLCVGLFRKLLVRSKRTLDSKSVYEEHAPFDLRRICNFIGLYQHVVGGDDGTQSIVAGLMRLVGTRIIKGFLPPCELPQTSTTVPGQQRVATRCITILFSTASDRPHEDVI